jgi:hypothetical protein
VRSTWWSARAIKLHLVIVVIVPTFAGLCAWQVDRALSGNELSWAYVFEWPFFAGYAVYMWWRFLHEAPDNELGSTSAGPSRTPAPATDAADAASTHATAAGATDGATDPDDADRAAYNRYLADLATQDKRKQWR